MVARTIRQGLPQYHNWSSIPGHTPTPTESTPEAINLIPDAYLGQQYGKVRNDLIALGLQVDGVPVADPAAPGTVTDINPAGPVQKGDTIKVTYSKGPEMIAVPEIKVGSSEAQVQSAIEKAGLRWVKGNDVDGEPGQDPGTFVSSEPDAGRKVESGSVVTYHLAKALVSTPAVPPSGPPTQG